jgi:hypothetical protein
MERPPIQDAFERQLEELGQQAGRLEDFLRGAEHEALQRHRRAIERRVPEEIWEQIEEHEGMDEGPHEVPRVNPPTRGREVPRERIVRNMLNQTQQAYEHSRIHAILRGEPLAPIEERSRQAYRRWISQAVDFRRPDWSQRRRSEAVRRIVAEWDPAQRDQTAFHDRIVRLVGY